MKNHYDTLGVEPTATKEEIKSAYLKLSRKMHPDMNDGDVFFTEVFKQINEANRILSDEVKRRNYDMQLRSAKFDHELLKTKESHIHTRQAQIVHRQFTRKMLIRGSVSLFGGLAAIALFSLSFDERNPAVTAVAPKHIAPVSAYDSVSSDFTMVNEHPVDTEELSMQTIYKETHKVEAQAEVPVAPLVKTTAYQQPVATRQDKIIETKTELIDLPKTFTTDDMQTLLAEIEQKKTQSANTSRCIRLGKTTGSNVENAFQLAGFLQSKGYVIAGRETTSAAVNGVNIDCSRSIIAVIIGRVED